MSSKPTIAFFGATGGCALNALSLTLKNGYTAIACEYSVDTAIFQETQFWLLLSDVRTPAKLTKLLTEAPHSISQKVLDSNLIIISGDINNVASIKTVFSHNPTVVISGVGGAPKMQASLLHPFILDQPTICADAAQNVVAALKELEAEKKLAVKPFLVVIGTTGMSHTRDVPILFMPLYHVVLEAPHLDKGNMEKTVIGAAKETPSVLSGYALMRPSLLTDGKSMGLDKIRMGWERHLLDQEGKDAGPGPAIGYTICRADIGLWMYSNLINGDASEWNGRCVTLTH
jgi:hypothetical protein